jgi:hypothetical protein
MNAITKISIRRAIMLDDAQTYINVYDNNTKRGVMKEKMVIATTR